jgi:hypothetical protein
MHPVQTTHALNRIPLLVGIAVVLVIAVLAIAITARLL